METKNKVIIGSVVVLTAFAAGRYSAPAKVVTETKVVEVEKKTEAKKEDETVKKKKKKTKIVITRPDGTKEEKTTIVDVTDKNNKKTSIEVTDKQKEESSKKEVVSKDSFTINVLGGVDMRTMTPVLGVQALKPVLGPVTIGVFGLGNGTLGGSLGLTF